MSAAIRRIGTVKPYACESTITDTAVIFPLEKSPDICTPIEGTAEKHAEQTLHHVCNGTFTSIARRLAYPEYAGVHAKISDGLKLAEMIVSKMSSK
jgi:hypothetical protein